MANQSNKYFPSFTLLNLKFSPGCRVIDNFSEHISFNICKKGNHNKSHEQELDKMVLENSSSSSIAIIVSDVSIKNNVATSIAHIHAFDKPLTKMIHHTIHVTSTEAELFTIRCGINQSLSINNISKIVVITDSIHTVKKIFNPSVHPYQSQSVTILSDLCKFFNHCETNSIEFWECPSHLKWRLHNEVDKETKMFNLMPLYLCKNLWEFSKNSESDDILNIWKIMFLASDLKENLFLNLLDNVNIIIKPSYAKEGSWLKAIGHLNSLCMWATRAITNHASISKYRLRFFPRKEFKCPCG